MGTVVSLRGKLQETTIEVLERTLQRARDGQIDVILMVEVGKQSVADRIPTVRVSHAGETDSVTAALALAGGCDYLKAMTLDQLE